MDKKLQEGWRARGGAFGTPASWDGPEWSPQWWHGPGTRGSRERTTNRIRDPAQFALSSARRQLGRSASRLRVRRQGRADTKSAVHDPDRLGPSDDL